MTTDSSFNKAASSEIVSLPPVLDPSQLGRIQSTHRGFLYQHLFAVGTLLLAGESGLEALIVERDEDVEVVFKDRRFYAQIKTRSRDLIPSDISDALSRFEEIREAHKNGTRTSVPEFWIITNAAPSPALVKEMEAWPKDIHLWSPYLISEPNSSLPPAWKGVEEAVQWCTKQAEKVPFGSLSPETLVWKLAGLVLFAASGNGHQLFETSQLPTLLEQLVVQLHRFPKLPAKYRPHEDEPDFNSDARIQLVVGFSGAGKTTWAAESSIHGGDSISYFDIGDMPTSAVAPSLARELAAILLPGKREEIRKLMLPGASGLQSLRALDLSAQKNGLSLTVVLDNVHRMGVNELIDIIKVAPLFRWILLAQPWPSKSAIETAFEIEAQSLRGWSLREIAEEFETAGCRLTPPQADRVRHLTGGLPLFVQSSSKLVRDYYDCDADKFCDQVESSTHTQTTGQEAILKQVHDRLPLKTAQAASLLAIPDVPLSLRDITSFVGGSMGFDEAAVAYVIRELDGWGIVENLRDGLIVMHDSFRPLAQQTQSSLTSETIVRAKKLLASALMTGQGRGVESLRLLCKLLPEIGQTETLVDVASNMSEYFHEFGMSGEFERILLESANSQSLSPTERFWALDTIVFWKIQDKKAKEAEAYFHQLEELAKGLPSGEAKIQEAVAIKRLLLACAHGVPAEVHSAFEAASALSRDDAEFQRILLYNYATCLLSLNEYSAAVELTSQLITEYLELLGLEPGDVILKNPPDIFPKLKKTDTQQDDLKHLADSLDLHAHVLNGMGRVAALERIQAFKFYAMAYALKSAMRLGMDIVDELLNMGDAIGARHFMESTMLNVFGEGQALDYFLQVHAQYAVVLAYCGDITGARRTMQELRTFLRAAPELQAEYENQQRLIELIAVGVARLPEARPVRASQSMTPRRKIGRNETCPCGSGKKYKRCCGQ